MGPRNHSKVGVSGAEIALRLRFSVDTDLREKAIIAERKLQLIERGRSIGSSLTPKDRLLACAWRRYVAERLARRRKR